MNLSLQSVASAGTSERVADHVAHLIKRRQHEIDRIVRILCAAFISKRSRAPRRGRILAICLVGQYADIGRADREDGARATYEIWAIVDHPEYRGLKKSWGPALRLLDRELGWRCSVELSVFDGQDLTRAIRENSMIREKVGRAIVLYDRRASGSSDRDNLSSSA